ncbi:S-layer homology domain-containing protein [Flintibacter porci]|uniref:S-layer homology domain-containing protein n=1 Tax=Flintibacter porci TaxID=3342383 RepID=UPI003F896643
MRKRMTSLLLTLVMLLSLVPAMGVTASAAELTTVNSYEELQTAVKAKKEYIQLGQNIDTKDFHYSGGGLDIADWLTFDNQTCTLDLNGKTLSLLTKMKNMPTFMRVYRGSNLTIKDSQGGGQITGKFENTGASDSYLIDMHQSSLTLEGGTFRATAEPYGTNVNVINYLESNVTIKDGVTISQPEHYAYGGGGSGLKGHGYALCEQQREFNYGDEVSHVVIDGGIFDGWVRLIGYPDTNGSVQINGGTFKKGVQALYVAKKNNSDPTVTVNGGTFEDNVYLQDWDWKESLYMPYRLNGGTFKGTVDLHAVNNITVYQKPESNPNVALGLNECFGYSAVVTPDGTFAGPDAKTGVLKKTGDYDYDMWLEGTASNPVRIIPNAWGMKSVKLDGTEIDYAKDWKGTVERMDNSTAHTLKFEWYPLAQELKDAGYTYRANFDCYTVGSNTPTTSVPISATATEYSHTIPAGAAPSVYPFDLQLNLDKNGSSVGIFGNQHIVKLVVSEAPPAPPEPPAPVAHSITVTNGRGTANPTSAMAGETVTVTAKDDTANYMMFTQWYTNTAGVTFTNVNDRVTTFVMPDCDVKVNPGFQQVSFTNQPTDSWLSSVDDSKVYFAFSQPITSWKLVNEDDTTLASGNAESANALVAATLARRDDGTEMTCRVIVTSNGQNFTSRTFDLKWYNVPGAPDVTVYPEGGKFVETLDVKLKTPNTYWGILYTTDGSDPYDKSGETWTKNPTAIEENDSTQVTIKKNTTIKACLYNSEGYSNMEKFGDIVTCDFTKVELTPPVADPPSGTSFYDSLNVSLSTDIVNAKIMWSYDDLDVDDLGNPGKWKEYEPEKESITLSGGYGTHGFYAVTGIRMEHPEGYTYWVHSDKQEYSYPRISYATIADASVAGKVNEEIAPVDVSITLSGDVFAEDLTAGVDVSSWFTNRPAGLTAKVKERTNYTKTLVITISGTPTEASAAAISVKMPKSALRYTGTGTAVEQTVLSNSNAVYNIGTDAVHTHNTNEQAWTPLNDSEHYRNCTAGDDPQFEDHKFNSWTKVDDNTHKATCTVCGYEKAVNHSWVFDHEDAPTLTSAGTRYYICSANGCAATKNESIPALTAIPAVNVTVTAPVKGAVPGTATPADPTYSVAYTDWEPTVSSTFAGGTKYTVKVSLEAIGNNRFTNSTTFQINGKTATVVTKTGEETVITFTFDATEGTPAATEYTVKFDGNGGTSSVSTMKTTDKKLASPLPTATRSGSYSFDGWYTEKNGGTKITTSTVFDKDTTVYAHWTYTGSTGGGGGGVTTYPITVKSAKNGDVTASHKSAAKGTTVTLTVAPDKGYVLDTLTVLDGKDKEIKLTEKNGKYTFTMPASKVTVEAMFKAAGNNPFTDVPAGSYYEDAVIWAVDKGITTGTSATTFNPNGICTRAQAVTFLWRAAGSPAAKSGAMPFADVKAGSYYYDAVLWAVEQGITKGTSETMFSPGATCTRAQIVTFLWRANGSPAVSGNSAFSDVAADAYYAAAVTWAEKNDVTGGIGGGLFGSNNNCTRAQIVTFIYRNYQSK